MSKREGKRVAKIGANIFRVSLVVIFDITMLLRSEKEKRKCWGENVQFTFVFNRKKFGSKLKVILEIPAFLAKRKTRKHVWKL